MVNLFLQEPRTVLDEPGGALFFDFTPGSIATVRQLIKEGFFRFSGMAFSSIAGHFMGLPNSDLGSMNEAGWAKTGTWVTTRPGFTASGSTVAFLAQKDDADWSLEAVGPSAAGQGRYLTLITYETQAKEGGVGTDGLVSVEFGGVWQLDLHETGEAVLYEKVTDTASGDEGLVPRGQFEWMTAEQFRGTLHRLWIYEVQAKLVIVNRDQSLEGRRAGFVYRDDGAPPDVENEDRDRRGVVHALREGAWKVSGGGFCTVNVCDQKWVPGDSTLTQTPTTLDPGGSTMEVEAEVIGQSNGLVTAAIECVDENGLVWPQGTNVTGVARYGIGWTVSWTSTATETFFLDAVSVKIPRVLRTEGVAGTDVLAALNIADRQIEVSREGDLTRDTLRALLTCYKLDLAGYVQPNMAVRYVVDGVTRFRGLTSDARWRVVADTWPQSGELELQAEGLFRRFRKQLWPGGKPFDGRLLTECLAEVLEAGGLDASEYELAAWPLRFAETPSGEAPSFVYRPGTSLDRILEDFQRKFYGTSLIHYFRMSDGKFVLAEVSNVGTPAATFYQTSPAAAAAGHPYQTIRDGSFSATLDDSELYNVVIVLGEAPDGRPLMARAVDWDSIRNTAAPNYVAEPWPLIVADPAFQTQGMVNYVCRQLYERHRRPKTYASWVSHRVDLWPGDLVALVGANYGFVYRLTGVQLTGGGQIDPTGVATYQGEKVA